MPNTELNLQSIRLVDDKTASLINSGEVISTLGLAVKELIENSLDANATVITVELHNYGVDCIEVSDNGSGISELDFVFISRRHCTSKIKEFNDLSALSTFGFRGEALSSLCSLSQLTIVTRHNTSAVATKLTFTSEGEISSKSTAARQIGTTVTIHNLFSNYPVRRKQLMETCKKEFQKMIQLITPYCLAFTDIQIQCRKIDRNKRTDVLCVTANNSIQSNIIQLFGHSQYESIQNFVKCVISPEILQEFDINETLKQKQDSIQITGFISKCDNGCCRSSPDRQFFIVNNRPVEFKRLKKLVNDVYSSFLKNHYPFVLLKIEIPQNRVDVNITPDKRTLMIENEQLILAIVKSSLLNMYDNRSTVYHSNSQLCSTFKTAAEMLNAV
ncbi:mismatch repair endonuclease PMS2-like isoform X5, partial [Leptotrombidium deliense]